MDPQSSIHPAILAGMQKHGITLKPGQIPYGFTKAYYLNRDSTAKIVSNRGAYRSGKTKGVIQVELRKARRHPGRVVWIMRKYFPWLRLTTMQMTLDQLKQWGWYRSSCHNKTAHEYYLGDSKLVFLSFDDEKKIGGGECNDVLMDEANEYTQDEVMTVLGRMSAPSPDEIRNQMFLPFNPVDGSSWLNAELNSMPDVQEVVTTMFDNPFLPRDYVESMVRFYKPYPNLYNVRILGGWGKTEGRIIQNIGFIDEMPPDSFFTVVANGSDWGTAAPTATLHAGWNREEPGNIYVDQVLYRTNLDNRQIHEAWLAEELDKRTAHVCDNNEPKTNKELASWGWNIIDAQKGDDSVRWGMNYLSRFKLIFTKRSVDAIREFNGWMRLKNRAGEYIDKEDPINNHCPAALRYIGEYFQKYTEQRNPEPSRARVGRIRASSGGSRLLTR